MCAHIFTCLNVWLYGNFLSKEERGGREKEKKRREEEKREEERRGNTNIHISTLTANTNKYLDCMYDVL